MCTHNAPYPVCGASIRNPKAESYVPKLPAAIASEVTIKQSSLDQGQSVRSTRTFLYLKQSLQSFPARS